MDRNANAQALILHDSSQAPSVDIEFPTGFKEVELKETQRALPLLTEATKVFQRFHQDSTRNHISRGKIQGIRPAVRIFRSDEYEEESYTMCSKLTVEEVKKLKNLFPNESLHNSIAVIVPDEESRKRLLDSGLEDQLDEIGFRVVTPMAASERLSNDVPLGDGKDEITVGTIGDMNGMERCFVIIVGMDRAQTEDKALNQINLSKIYCACTRGMLHICLINCMKFVSEELQEIVLYVIGLL